jgi:protein gp37
MLKPLPNVWLGISAENHEYANLRIPYLLETPASVRFLSCEPLLSEIRLDKLDYSQFVLDISKRVRHPFDPYLHYNCLNPTNHWQSGLSLPAIDWVIVGGESGPGARHMDPDWARSIRDQCKEAGVAFFMKQMTHKAPIPEDLFIREMPDD